MTARAIAASHPGSRDGLVGRTLGGQYTLTRLLGRGGFGAVYHALQAPIERPVAVKVIGGAGHDPADLRRRFVLEARALAQVSAHSNGVGLIELGEEPDGLLYIVQDFIDGRSLDAVLREDGPLEPDRAVRIVCAVLDALDAAHHHGIVHRDVKPSNVMLVTDHRGRERVKLLDFGIAHVVGAVRGGISPTATGVIVGSPQYMAPEQFSGEGISSRVDLYAVGVLLYELLTGAPPFEGTAVELMHHHLSRPPQPIAAERGVPAALEAVVERALCKSPFGRYCDAVAMRAALEAATAGEAPGGSESARRGWATWLAWVASVGLAVWVGWMAGEAGGEGEPAMTGAASAPLAVETVADVEPEEGAAAHAGAAASAAHSAPGIETAAAAPAPVAATPDPAAAMVPATTAPAAATNAAMPAPAAAMVPATTAPAAATNAAIQAPAVSTNAAPAAVTNTATNAAPPAPAASTHTATPAPAAATKAAMPAAAASTVAATPAPAASTPGARPAPAAAAPGAMPAPSPTPEAPPAAVDPATRPLVDALDRCDCAAAARHYSALGAVAEPLRAEFDARCRRFGDGCLGR